MSNVLESTSLTMFGGQVVEIVPRMVQRVSARLLTL